jgi:hypothetical protein
MECFKTNTAAEISPAALKKGSFVLVSVLSELLLTLMGCDFSQFAFSSAGHFGVSFPQDGVFVVCCGGEKRSIA